MNIEPFKSFSSSPNNELLKGLAAKKYDHFDRKSIKIFREVITTFKQNEAINDKGENLLIACAKSENSEIALLALDCLKMGANIHFKAKNGAVALHYACLANNANLVQALLEKGADPLLKSAIGNSSIDIAADVAVKRNSFSVILTLLENKPDLILVPLKNRIPFYVAIAESLCQAFQYHCFEEVQKINDFLINHLERFDLQQTSAEGLTLFQMACAGFNQELAVKLILQGAKSQNTPSEQAYIKQIVDQMIAREFSGQDDIPFIKALGDQDSLPFGPSREGKSYILTAIKVASIKPLISGELLSHLEQIDFLIDQFKNEKDLLSKIENSKKLEISIKNLEQTHKQEFFSYQKFYQELVCPFINRVNVIQQWLEQFRLNPQLDFPEFTDEFSMHSIPFEDLFSVCNLPNYQALLPNLFHKHFFCLEKIKKIDRPIFHYLLDKSWSRTDLAISEKEAEAFHGGETHLNGTFLAMAIQSTLQSDAFKASNKNIQAVLKTFARRFLPVLYDCIKWNQAEKVSPKTRLQAAQEIVDKIACLTYEEFVLIPAGCVNHAVSLCVEKTSEDKARFIFYNSGGGLINYHPRWKNTNRYQTHIIIEDVPLKDLQKCEVWELVFKLKSSEGMDGLYQHFFEMGKNGRCLPPSNCEEDYEAKQMRGTCSAQHLMSCSRHQIMNQIEGSVLEKLGIYHLIKAYFLKQMGQSAFTQIDTRIQGFVQEKLAKQEAILKLAHFAENEETYQHHLIQLLNALQEFDAKSFVEMIQNLKPSSFFMKFAILELCSKKLAELWEKSACSSSSNPSLVLASVLYTNRLLLRDRLIHFLEDCYSKKAFKELGIHLAYFILSSRFYEDMHQIVLRDLCPPAFDLNDPDRRVGLDAFILNLNEQKSGRIYLQELASFLSTSRHQITLAEYINSHCTLEKK